MPTVFTREQVERYHREGVLFPVPALSRPEVERFRVGYFDLEARLGGKPSAQQLSQTHLYFRWAYDLATHPAVLDAVEAILGPNILVWTVSIFPKHARDPGYISWHQDGTYWALSSTQVTTAWVALTDSTVENGCMAYVSGSHRHGIFEIASDPERPVHHVPLTGDIRLREEVLCPVPAGSVIFHHGCTLHRSAVNETNTWRRALIFHYTTADARSEAAEGAEPERRRIAPTDALKRSTGR